MQIVGPYHGHVTKQSCSNQSAVPASFNPTRRFLAHDSSLFSPFLPQVLRLKNLHFIDPRPVPSSHYPVHQSEIKFLWILWISPVPEVLRLLARAQACPYCCICPWCRACNLDFFAVRPGGTGDSRTAGVLGPRARTTRGPWAGASRPEGWKNCSGSRTAWLGSGSVY